jgi:delta-aminolevulinic acid dehydratase/porphobilinogen synthase
VGGFERRLNPRRSLRSAVQIDAANAHEALREVALEGRTSMVKPALAYLDILYQGSEFCFTTAA